MFNDQPFSTRELLRQGAFAGLKGALNFMSGMVLGVAGGYQHIVAQPKMSLTESVKLAIPRSMVGFILQFSWKNFIK